MISGQDGAYLAKLLVDKGYKVVGGDRRTASGSLWRLEELGIAQSVEIVEFELAEITNIKRTIQNFKVDEVRKKIISKKHKFKIYPCDTR